MLLLRRNEVSALFESMQDWIERTGTELVAVTTKFFDQRQAVDSFLDGMMKDMQADQSCIKMFFVHLYYRTAIVCIAAPVSSLDVLVLQSWVHPRPKRMHVAFIG